MREGSHHSPLRLSLSPPPSPPPKPHSWGRGGPFNLFSGLSGSDDAGATAHMSPPGESGASTGVGRGRRVVVVGSAPGPGTGSAGSVDVSDPAAPPDEGGRDGSEGGNGGERAASAALEAAPPAVATSTADAAPAVTEDKSTEVSPSSRPRPACSCTRGAAAPWTCAPRRRPGTAPVVCVTSTCVDVSARGGAFRLFVPLPGAVDEGAVTAAVSLGSGQLHLRMQLAGEQ